MQTLQLITPKKGHYEIEGDLTFFTINKSTIETFNFLINEKQVCIDLIKINNADSAGLALIIEWIKLSRKHNTLLTFKNIPQQLHTLATLCGFEENKYINECH